jgi:UDP-glucose 6-dehydrogenase
MTPQEQFDEVLERIRRETGASDEIMTCAMATNVTRALVGAVMEVASRSTHPIAPLIGTALDKLADAHVAMVAIIVHTPETMKTFETVTMRLQKELQKIGASPAIKSYVDKKLQAANVYLMMQNIVQGKPPYGGES